MSKATLTPAMDEVERQAVQFTQQLIERPNAVMWATVGLFHHHSEQAIVWPELAARYENVLIRALPDYAKVVAFLDEAAAARLNRAIARHYVEALIDPDTYYETFIDVVGGMLAIHPVNGEDSILAEAVRISKGKVDSATKSMIETQLKRKVGAE